VLSPVSSRRGVCLSAVTPGLEDVVVLPVEIPVADPQEIRTSPEGRVAISLRGLSSECAPDADRVRIRRQCIGPAHLIVQRVGRNIRCAAWPACICVIWRVGFSRSRPITVFSVCGVPFDESASAAAVGALQQRRGIPSGKPGSASTAPSPPFSSASGADGEDRQAGKSRVSIFPSACRRRQCA
jgi:hypothetical protein